MGQALSRVQLREGHASINAALDRESERLFGAVDAASHRAGSDDKSAVTALFGTRSFSALSRSRKRQLLESLRADGAAAFAASTFRALDAAALDPSELSAYVELFARLPLTPAWQDVLRRSAIAFSLVPGAARKRAIDWLMPPRPSASSFAGHEATLTGAWASRALELVELLERSSAGEMSAFFFSSVKAIYALDSPAFPGAMIVCFGEPGNPETHAYSRRVFLDSQRRLNVVIKSPVEAIRTSWRAITDPRAAQLNYRKWMISRAQERALIEWMERDHVISGLGDPHEPKLRHHSTFEAMLQLDVRLPRMISLIAGTPGARPIEVGKLSGGRPVPRAGPGDRPIRG